MSDIKDWAITAGGNGFGVPDGFPEGMVPAGVNNAAREVMAAVRRFYDDSEFRNIHSGATIVKNTAQQFSVLAGDHTSFYTTGRRIRVVGDTTVQLFVASSTFGGGNTTVNTTTGTVPENPTEVGVHQSPSLGNAAFLNGGAGNGLDADTVDGVQLAGLLQLPGGIVANDLLQWTGSALVPAKHDLQTALASETTINVDNLWATVTALTAAVTVPATGNYAIKATVAIAYSGGAGANEGVVMQFRLNEDIDAGGPNVVELTGDSARDPVTPEFGNASLLRVVNPATPGSTYTYTVEARGRTTVPGGGATTAIISEAAESQTSRILVELIPVST